jgi:hypothetical protein
MRYLLQYYISVLAACGLLRTAGTLRCTKAEDISNTSEGLASRLRVTSSLTCLDMWQAGKVCRTAAITLFCCCCVKSSVASGAGI